MGVGDLSLPVCTIVSQQPAPLCTIKEDELSCAYNHLRLSSIVSTISQYFALSHDKTPLFIRDALH
nr:MAG TPA: hypothetical protein [Caudoviricetes sp.]